MDLLQVKNVSKHVEGFSGTRQLILTDVNFTINSVDSFTSILAPYGAGKTTLLKTIAALEVKHNGEIKLFEKIYDKCGKGIAYIPENPSSFPWLDVKGNILLEQKISGMQKTKKLQTEHFISLVGLSGYEDYFPANKSNGFRFRVSLARALSAEPKLILIDDCFKKMTEETREELYKLLKNINEKKEVSFLLASTNVNEVLRLSTKVFLMKNNPGTIFGTLNIDQKEIPQKISDYTNQIEKLFRNEKMLNSKNLILLIAGITHQT